MSDSAPKPWEFAVGSAESRAAARAVFQERDRGVRRIQLVNDLPRPVRSGDGFYVSPWGPVEGGGFVRLIGVPHGTDEEIVRRLLATP